MKVILTYNTAKELSIFENDIKNETGNFSPRFNPETKSFVRVVTGWPFVDDFQTDFFQEKLVKKDFEDDVDDVAFIKLKDGLVSYKDGFGFSKPKEVNEWSLFIYDPSGKNPVIFKDDSTLAGLLESIKEYRLGLDNFYRPNISFDEAKMHLDKIFGKLRGYATFLLLNKDNLVYADKFSHINKPYDYLMGNT